MDMKNMYGGIFVKSFVMFYGDKIRYYITEESDEGEKETAESSIEYSPSMEGVASGRYELLNTIMEDKAVGDKDSLESHSALYELQNAAVGLFKPAL